MRRDPGLPCLPRAAGVSRDLAIRTRLCANECHPVRPAAATMTAIAPAATRLPAIHGRMKALAAVARLPLRRGQWSGVTGSVLGQGTGSSIDFQDHRPYLPGDDPRHINWQA